MRHATTTGEYTSHRDYYGVDTITADDPIEPDDVGPWSMTGSAAVNGALFWFWEAPDLTPTGSDS